MSISFIVTSYNIDPYIEKCLQTVQACAQAGDEIIIVDDGSKDQTPAIIRAFAKDKLPDGVSVVPVLLGTNTFGGVGIAANIGMGYASKETVFFVDGDDWLEPAGFAACRSVFETRNVDFLLTNYRTFDTEQETYASPADEQRWSKIKPDLTEDERLDLALSFIAVPWRKFYRRSFLQKAGLRFPEGDFFFEDNPFHWEVCRKAQSFSFFNRVTCYHRINRPGQTMESTGTELLAFFTHYETITAPLAAGDVLLRTAAMRWLVNNMSWHLNRLHPDILRSWGQRAMICLQDFDDTLWERFIAPQYANHPIGNVCEDLRANDLRAFLQDRKLAALSEQMTQLKNDIRHLAHHQQSLRDLTQAQSNAQEYAALLELYKES
jgi:glycosyltransferase involved in cell wall biosynthesis